MTDDELVRELREKDIDRFWSKVSKSDGCWTWLGGLDGKGYGYFRLGSRMVGSYRLAYELLIDPVPDGLVLDHLCRNRKCVNPWHLEPVTNRENVLRGSGITAMQARQTHCKRGHAYAFNLAKRWLRTRAEKEVAD